LGGGLAMTWLRGWAATALAYTLAGLAVVGGVLATLARQKAKGRAEERQRATTQAWEQAHEAERQRIADDATRNTADARERLRNLAKRRGEWPE
jgi:hypothetical protein